MPNVNRLVRSIIELIEKGDLHSPKNNEKFCLKLMKTLNFDNWVEYDQLAPFRKNLI
jgi:Asp-tRNA(Asn)/Glu-tRNA(Gln) amidotransferase B subunit